MNNYDVIRHMVQATLASMFQLEMVSSSLINSQEVTNAWSAARLALNNVSEELHNAQMKELMAKSKFPTPPPPSRK